MKEQVFTNYRLVLPTLAPDQPLVGTLVVQDGRIADVQPGTVAQGQDGNGNYLLPGLIELHTDNLERCISPRPGVEWPLVAAAAYHDRELAAAGITTVCDAIALGDITPDSPRLSQSDPAIDTLCQEQLAGRFAIDHRLHLRCELAYEQVTELAAAYIDHPLLSLVSLMDHTPGQRQFISLEKYKTYYQGKRGVSEAQMEAFIQDRLEAQQQHAAQNRHQLATMARQRKIVLASHDDATVDHVQEAVADGVSIAEFPTTLAAAQEAHRHGLQILMGAPNWVLGGSQSGNVSAAELVAQGWVDLFSSDYVPQSLVQALFAIAQQPGYSLPQAARLFTLNPAKAIGLDCDRGSLEPGQRADFITVHDDGALPRLRAVFCQGERVA